MNWDEFIEIYCKFKDVDQIEIDCDHPKHIGDKKQKIKKQAAKRNILKHAGEKYVCRDCMRDHEQDDKDGPLPKNKECFITVMCPREDHVGDKFRQMKATCYFGPNKEPFTQICNSCSQRGKEVSEEQKAIISESLTGRKLTEEHKQNISNYYKNNPETAEKKKENLVPHGGWNKGLETPAEVRKKQSKAKKGKKNSEEHCKNIAEGRKKMLQEQGGFTVEHRQNLSKAAIEQYKKGFNPKSYNNTGWHVSPKAGRIYFRSSYGKKAYEILDSDPNVIKYFVESTSAEYYHPDKNIMCNYLIDLEISLLDGTRKLLDIKPLTWLNKPIIEAKIKAGYKKAEESGMTFEVWTEVDLFGEDFTEKTIQQFVESINKEGAK